MSRQDLADAESALPRESWASSPAVRRSMRGNRSRDTRPEKAVRSALHRRGFRFRVAARPIRDLRRTADIVFPTERVAVQVDGCYWHGCPDHYKEPSTNSEYWLAKIERNRARDADSDERWARAGWLVVHHWEHEELDSIVENVARLVVRRRDEFSGWRPS